MKSPFHLHTVVFAVLVVLAVAAPHVRANPTAVQPLSDPSLIAAPAPDALRIAPGTDLVALLAHGPQTVSFTVDTAPPPPATTATIGDLHAVYALPLSAIREVVSDYNGYPDFVPRVTFSQAERIADSPPIYHQRLTLSFRVLFFGSDYDYYLQVVEPRVASADEFVMHYRMTQSIDGQLSGVAGSWYLRAVTIDGREHTYARYYNRIDFARDQFGLRLALRNLGANDMRQAMIAFGREAERRQTQPRSAVVTEVTP